MYAISLTAIPPRFDRLGPVLEALLAQDPAPARVILALPNRPARFAPAPAPEVPAGVETWPIPGDPGPATKVLPAARALAGRVDRLIYCDDDWVMPRGWAARLLHAVDESTAAAASGYDVARLRRQSHRLPNPDFTDVAQGYAGVCIRPGWLAGAACAPPRAAWAADDVWLSAQLARQGIAIRLAQGATDGMAPAAVDACPLQAAVIDGRTRHAANLACAAEVTARYGIWPPLARTDDASANRDGRRPNARPRAGSTP